MLRDRLPGMHVAALCGGAIAWYNDGFPVVDPQGRPVQALHPGSRRVLGYITAPNAFHLPKRAGLVTRDAQRAAEAAAQAAAPAKPGSGGEKKGAAGGAEAGKPPASPKGGSRG